MKEDGYRFFKEGQELVQLVLIDGSQYEMVYEPTEDDIHLACLKYELKEAALLKLIREKNPAVHTLFIDVPVYKANGG